MKRKFTKLLAVLLTLCLAVSAVAVPGFAATVGNATIDTSKTGELTIYKYDFTNAAKDGIWTDSSYVSTGQYDAKVNNILGDATRKGANGAESTLGNDAKSNGYAIRGVEFTYLKVAEPYQFHESENNGTEFSYIELLYKFDKTLSANLLSAIGLAGGQGSYDKANALDTTAWFYRSDVISKALADSLEANATTVKNALEAYVKANGGTAMPLTDGTGKTYAGGMPLGLYLLVETKVPEGVTETVAPSFISLPMTNVDGGGNGVNGNTTSIADGGHSWLYSVTIYPKNETGIVSLEKTVREEHADTGTHNGTTDDITDGYKHYATASTGDVVNYQIVSTLPTITSASTYLSEYTFTDILAAGLSYTNDPVKIEWFTDADCTDKVTEWDAASGKFTPSEVKNADGSHTLTITMTEAGLNEINTANTSANNVNGKLYAGYSNYTIRITYNAKLNSDKSMIYGDEGNCNKVALKWRRTSSEHYDILVDDCHVYSYGLVIDKDFSDGKTEQSLYDHVKFKVQNAEDDYFVIAQLNESEGIWYVTGHTTNEDSGTAMYPVTWNNEPGQLVIKGLEDDAYILTEIETANSYILLAENIDIEITTVDDASRPCGIYGTDVKGLIQNDSRFNFDGGLDLSLANIPQRALAHNMLTASATEDDNKIVMLNDEMDTTSTNALAQIKVVNNHGFKLPQTGETTAKNLPIIGGMIIGIAALGLCLVFIPKRKKEST